MKKPAYQREFHEDMKSHVRSLQARGSLNSDTNLDYQQHDKKKGMSKTVEFKLHLKISKPTLSNKDGAVGAMAEQSTAALRVVGSIPARNKNVYNLQVVVPGLCCLCM